jgi:hypothetical protein
MRIAMIGESRGRRGTAVAALRRPNPTRHFRCSVRPTHQGAEKTCVCALAARCARVLRHVTLPRWQRAQGKPGARCTRGLACKMCTRTRTRAYRFSGEHPAFPAQWFYGLLRALPGEAGSFATVTSRIDSAKLGASVGRQDHTTSPSASATFVFVTSASTASHRNVRDDRDPPLSWVRRAKRNH